jgi:hypothetical protein
VPIDEEQPDFALAIKEEAQRTLQEKIVSSGLGGLLHHMIPVVGPAVTELMTDLAIQRTNNRMYDMFEHFTKKIRDIGEEKVDREWFRSEEFQTLLFEALRQLHVTHDRQKIEMLGVALANSGALGFKDDESKELFIRFVRELTQQHVKMLFELAPMPLPVDAPLPLGVSRREEMARNLEWERRPTLTPRNDDLLALQMLLASIIVPPSAVELCAGRLADTIAMAMCGCRCSVAERLQPCPVLRGQTGCRFDCLRRFL